jgi:hypothetical protein
MNRRRILHLTTVSMLLAFLLPSSGPPVSAIRRDWTFWNMLTPAGRERLASVSVVIRESCGGTVPGTTFTGGRYCELTDAIELCGIDPLQDPDRLRHEALHALDWGVSDCRELRRKTGRKVEPNLEVAGTGKTEKSAVCPTGMASEVSGLAKRVPPDLYRQAEEAYRCVPGGGCHGWFKPGELWAMLPIIVGWDFDALPPDIARFYAPWFEDAQ